MNHLECMATFVQVVERSGISRAARAMQISPATVSTQITHLEKHLGVQLLVRTTRNLSVTDDGVIYYSHCKKILSEIAEADALFGRERSAPHGRLRVDASVTFINRLILPVLAGFRGRYPGIEIELLHTEHLFDSAQEGLDVMIRLGPLEDSTLVARLLGSTSLIVAASPGYLERHGEPKTPQDLLNHTCLNFIEPRSGRVTDWEFERGKERITIHPRPGIGFNQGESRVAAALLDLGVYRGMTLNMDHLINDGSLKVILKAWTAPSLPIYAAYSQHRNLSPKIRVFVDYLLECYSPGHPMRANPKNRGEVLRMAPTSNGARKVAKGTR